jgi:hypothetical protein
MIEKKKAKNAALRREDSPTPDLGDEDIYGGDDFRARFVLMAAFTVTTFTHSIECDNSVQGKLRETQRDSLKEWRRSK